MDLKKKGEGESSDCFDISQCLDSILSKYKKNTFITSWDELSSHQAETVSLNLASRYGYITNTSFFWPVYGRSKNLVPAGGKIASLAL